MISIVPLTWQLNNGSTSQNPIKCLFVMFLKESKTGYDMRPQSFVGSFGGTA